MYLQGSVIATESQPRQQQQQQQQINKIQHQSHIPLSLNCKKRRIFLQNAFKSFCKKKTHRNKLINISGTFKCVHRMNTVTILHF